MKKLFAFFALVVLTTVFQALPAAKSYSTSYSSANVASTPPAVSFQSVPPQLQAIVAKLLELPEARQLLAQISREGKISIVIDNDASGQFDALWDGTNRVIRLNSYRHQTQGSWICSILFEMHNASTDRHMSQLFKAAEQNQMAKDKWVEEMERMEHRNAQKTCTLLDKGIALGLYSADARWNIFYSFDDHYKLQQLTDHSGWLARNYDRTNIYGTRQEYKGTIPGINSMSTEEKEIFQNYLVAKNNLESPSLQHAEEGKAWLKKEYARIEGCFLGKRSEGCMRNKEKIKLLHLAFKGNTEFETLARNSPLYSKS